LAPHSLLLAQSAAHHHAKEHHEMGTLSNVKHERFAQERAAGRTITESWRIASGTRSRYSASVVGLREDVLARIAELRDDQQDVRRRIIDAAAAKLEVSAEAVISELAKLAFANMADYISIGADGEPVLDFASLTRDQAAAIQEITIDEFSEGRGADARRVRRVKFKLANKRTALMALGTHLGIFVSGPTLQLDLVNTAPAPRQPTAAEWEAELNAGEYDE
jgi:phage terminase small subunit